MPKITQLSEHVANLIAAGEVVERPASVAKELLENAVDAGASQVTIEIRDGGMTFLRVTDNGCGMLPEDAETAFLRHATSKLHCAEDLAAIGTMGFRGEALAAIASVSRIDLLTKTPGSLFGTSLHLEAGKILEKTEVGCPDGTTIIIRDLFYNTPARMKFMKSDSVEGSRITAAVQLQALAHPSVAIRLLRDGKEVLSTPGNGTLSAAVYSIYGRECARMVEISSRWDAYSITGYVSKPTDARPSRNLQTFLVNGRPVKSKLLTAALEEAYRNRIMVGKFPACVLHITLPASAVDVNVHPAKTEVKFLNEKAVFDCVHYGVLGALNKTTDRPQVQFKSQPVQDVPQSVPEKRQGTSAPSQYAAGSTKPAAGQPGKKQEPFFRTMTPEEFKAFSGAISSQPRPEPRAAANTAQKVSQTILPLHDSVILPSPEKKPVPPPAAPAAVLPDPEPIQEEIALPQVQPWRMVGELYNSYILVEQGEEAFLIDKHAAHERILFDKLKQNQEAISTQVLITPASAQLGAEAASALLSGKALLADIGFDIEEFGDNTILLREIPMDLSEEDAVSVIEELADELLSGHMRAKEDLRDELLHTVACKAAIKAGWHSDEKELLKLAEQVMAREDLKYCPHGRPICITLSKKQLEKQFKRT